MGLEPQDDSDVNVNVIKEILTEQVKSHKKITELGKTVPVQFITEAKAFISRCSDFKSEIEEDLEDVVEQLREIKQKFIGQIHNNHDNKRGVLTSKLEEYLSCLNLGTETLEKLFAKDEKKWKDNLTQTQKGLTKMTENLQVLLVEQEMKLRSILNPAQFIKPDYVLRKLQMWGDQVEYDKVNFEWPTVEILQELGKDAKDLKLTSMKFEQTNYYNDSDLQKPRRGGRRGGYS